MWNYLPSLKSSFINEFKWSADHMLHLDLILLTNSFTEKQVHKPLDKTNLNTTLFEDVFNLY